MLLLDRGRLGVALSDDDAATLRAQFARHLLPDGLADVVTEADGALRDRLREKNAPTVIGHLHRAVAGPALRVHAGCGAQVDVSAGEVVRSYFIPPVEELGLPVLQRALQCAVVDEIDVVG